MERNRRRCFHHQLALQNLQWFSKLSLIAIPDLHPEVGARSVYYCREIPGNPWTVPSVDLEMLWCEPGNLGIDAAIHAFGNRNAEVGVRNAEPQKGVSYQPGVKPWERMYG